jgi:GntR family transcriptional regulator
VPYNAIKTVAGPLPPFRRIAERFRAGILRGDYIVGDRLPSVRGLAIDEGVNPNTVQAAYNLLETEGWIVRHAGVGVFVREAPAMKRAARRERLTASLVATRRDARRIGADNSDWRHALDKAEGDCDLPGDDR